MANRDTESPATILETISSPADLRALPQERLPQVCGEIREFLISSLSRNPGHFASSMGAVEITVALHYVFNTPYDRIVWDVGHQAYGHKILTGRRERFDTNRKFGGLSGFPNPDESEYDTFSAGHASNSISAALGMAVASRMNADSPGRNVVAVIGDASISGGLAFEGINNAANTPNNLLIILNDNDMSIDANVGSLHSYLARITSSKGYNNLRYKAFRLLKRMHIVTDSGRGRIMRFNNSLKSLLSHQQNIFEGLNVRYFGPVDGHDINQLVRTLNDIKDMTGPRILHIKTVKGKGFAPAEKDPASWHAPGKFDPATGERAAAKSSGSLKFQDVFGATLLELARADRRVTGITAAMPTGTSVSILGDAMPERMFDVGISEEHAVTFAGGLAKEGLRPVVAIYSSFLQRSYDQIINDISLQRLPVMFCIDRAGLVGEDGATHHGVFDMAYLRAVPGMTVAAPRNLAMLRDMMHTALAHTSGPFAIRYPRGGCRTPYNASVPVTEIAPGTGEKIADGTDAVIISVGISADDASEARGILLEKGISAAHYDLRYIKPLDTAMLDEIAGRGVPVITVEDGAIIGGAGSAINEYYRSKGSRVALTALGIPDRFIAQGTVPQLKACAGIDAAAIASAVEACVKSQPAKELSL